MTTQWYYKVMGEEVGPVSSAELLKQSQAGVITPDTFVRPASDENWHVAQAVEGLFQKQAPTGAIPGVTQKGSHEGDEKGRGAQAAVRQPRQAYTREMAQKLCGRIDSAMCGIRAEVEDEEIDHDQIADICDTLRPIVKRLEELEGGL